ncbi:hypothetical protein ALC62_12648 [Cyphomyrmex costatus]|uniref:DUF4817 domain-containing protein n=1 Tax=Cyphomyrmex costatus TaxID=456900 RepID=A0A151IAW6_9HYME|nr:hypothetical protein ALC62_12648 [Cyphomyrmex costatus]
MADYQPEDIIAMIMVLGESHNNYRAAARLYAERFPDRRHPDHRTISTLTERARGGHMVRYRRRHEYDENDARVLTFFFGEAGEMHLRIPNQNGNPGRVMLD